MESIPNGPAPKSTQIWKVLGALVLCSFLYIGWATYSHIQGQKMIEAIHRHDTPAVKSLLALGAGVDAMQGRKAREFSGWTALTWAALADNDNPDIVNALLEAGADVNAKGWMQATPLTHAAEHANVRVAQSLLKHGAKVDMVGALGYTPLMIASGALPLMRPFNVSPQAYKKRAATMVKLLLDAGADVNPKNREGRTALSFAAEHDNLAVVKLLLAKGADPDIQDEKGYTARNYAERSPNDAIYQLLQK